MSYKACRFEKSKFSRGNPEQLTSHHSDYKTLPLHGNENG